MARIAKCAALACVLALSAACWWNKTGPDIVTTTNRTTSNGTAVATLSGTVTTVSDEPIAFAMVKAESEVVAVTDATGKYQATFSVRNTVGTAITVEKTGYRPVGRLFNLNGGVFTADFKLEALDGLVVGSTVTGTISGDDPPTYVGAAYDSAYLRHTKYFTFTTPTTDDAVVKLTWTQTGNAALVLWIQGGADSSSPVSGGQEIHLPQNSSGNLLVGQTWEAGPLSSAPVPFTLEMRMAGAGATVSHHK